jgi:3-oxoacyl-[acyl-carrier-protein] synthase-1
MRRVVVSGLGIVSSIGNNASEVSDSLGNARSGVVSAPDYAAHGFKCQVEARPQLDWESLVDRRAARFLSEGMGWGHIAMEQAIADAGLETSDISDERTGLIAGSGGPSTHMIVAAADKTRETGSPKRIGPFAVPKAMCSGISAVLSTWFKIKGINYSISSACATSAHCIGNAYESIAWGKQDIMFAGGSEDLDWTLSALFDAMGAMSSSYNDTPARASRAFDKNRDGFVIAGGAGIVVLEEYEHAKARGAKIYAELTGYGATSDGHDMVAPSGEGAARCMRQALAMSGDRRVDYLNPHGTGTPVGDLKEMGAVRDVFSQDIPLISSTKSLTGHSLGAAGAQEAIYALLMMEAGFACESAHIDDIDPEFSDLPILRARKEVQIETAMSNSFGFGGTNATLMFSKV